MKFLLYFISLNSNWSLSLLSVCVNDTKIINNFIFKCLISSKTFLTQPLVHNQLSFCSKIIVIPRFSDFFSLMREEIKTRVIKLIQQRWLTYVALFSSSPKPIFLPAAWLIALFSTPLEIKHSLGWKYL